ncbi:MAG: hypothetical protein AAFY59_16705, partial [Pseudomonadota bacterium]
SAFRGMRLNRAIRSGAEPVDYPEPLATNLSISKPSETDEIEMSFPGVVDVIPTWFTMENESAPEVFSVGPSLFFSETFIEKYENREAKGLCFSKIPCVVEF